MRKTAIVLAGGKGERMGGSVPKQFLEIHGKPILMYSLELFFRFDPQIKLILVLPEGKKKTWREMCKRNNFSIPHQITTGGKTRFHSVQRGLELVELPSLVAIHDGVRPLVSQTCLAECFEMAEKKKAAVPVVELVESIRFVQGAESRACDRGSYKLVQTPQMFDGELLKDAYQQKYSDVFTDDASVVEARGHTVFLTKGNRENIKITTPFELKIAELFLREKFSE